MEDLALPAWAIEIIKQAGPYAVLFVVMLYYIPRRAVQSFISSQRDQAIAMSGIKDALATLAERGTRLDDKMDVCVLNQRLMVDRIEEMSERAERHRTEMKNEMQQLRGLMLEWTKNILAERSAG